MLVPPLAVIALIAVFKVVMLSVNPASTCGCPVVPPEAGFNVTTAIRIPVELVSNSLTKVCAAFLALVILLLLPLPILPESSITKITSVVLGIFFPSTIRFIFHFPGVAVASAVFSICTAPGLGHSRILEVVANAETVLAAKEVDLRVLALLFVFGKVNGATLPIKTGPPR